MRYWNIRAERQGAENMPKQVDSVELPSIWHNTTDAVVGLEECAAHFLWVKLHNVNSTSQQIFYSELGGLMHKTRKEVKLGKKFGHWKRDEFFLVFHSRCIWNEYIVVRVHFWFAVSARMSCLFFFFMLPIIPFLLSQSFHYICACGQLLDLIPFYLL